MALDTMSVGSGMLRTSRAKINGVNCRGGGGGGAGHHPLLRQGRLLCSLSDAQLQQSFPTLIVLPSRS